MMCKSHLLMMSCRNLNCAIPSSIVILLVVSLTLAEDFISRDVETFLKVSRDVDSRMDYYDDSELGYTSVTSMFSGKNCTSDNDCRPWYYCQGGCCNCGEEHDGIMLCEEDNYRSAVLSCHCITYDNNSTYVGSCIYRCANEFQGEMFDPVYSEILNDNVHDKVGNWVNNFSCGFLNRTGMLCGKCLDNHSTIAYSYELNCMECPEQDVHKNWIKYIVAAYSFLTVFYFVVLFLKVNVTSSCLHGFVFYSQAVAMPTNIRFILLALVQKPNFVLPSKLLLSIYGISNLDFFRTLYPQFCLNTSTLGTIALDYGLAIYPLILILITFVLMKLHQRNFKPIICVCKPFHKLFSKCHRNWDMQTSAVDAYATLFLLSFSKVLNVTFDLLAPTGVFKLNGHHRKVAVYNDANLIYFSREHMLPHGILGIVFLMFFIVLPVTLLLFYPCRRCRACLNSVGLHSEYLQTFVHAFQGCYKDGSDDGKKDYRYFSAFYLILRILLFVVFGITLGTIFFAFAAAILLLFTLLVITVQPHRSEYSHYTKIDATFLLLLVIMCTIFLGINIATVKGHRHIETCFVLAVVFGIVPFLYLAGVAVYTIHVQKKWDLQIVSHFRAWRHGYRVIDDPDDDSSLPDRLLNPTSYADCSIQAQIIRQSPGMQTAVGTAY